ncbi:MAG: hypothetical protein KME31_01550 [Tolypothrix carrinoi HA7290-LM1]|jgi:N-acetyl-gamma-glutamylphosphate reductase|nr:hypothetical protein [Tolypothrix carrinoi HA7290-LM1]
MTKAEVLEALKKMTTEERLEIIEIASKLIRQEIVAKSKVTLQKQLSLSEAAEVMRSFYEEGSEVVIFADRDTQDFYEYEDYA